MKKALAMILSLVMLCSIVLSNEFVVSATYLDEDVSAISLASDLDKSLTQEQIYINFLNSFGHLSESNFGGNTPTDYAIIDINQDGIKELLVQASDGTGFYITSIYTLDIEKSEVILISSDGYCYGGMSYSSKYNCLEFAYSRPSEMGRTVKFMQLSNNKYTESFELVYSAYDGSTRRYCRIYDEYGNVESVYDISEEEWSAYLDTRDPIKWDSIYKETSDGFLYLIVNGKAVIAGIGVESSSEKIVIPSTIEGYPVTEIQKLAISDHYLKEITIPSSVVEIHEGAFSGCYNFQTVVFTGTKSQWDNIEIGKNNDYLLEATLLTSFDPIEYPHPYSNVIYDALQKTKMLPYKRDGYGILYDIDDNGIEELIFIYSAQRDGVSSGILERKCSVYTLQNKQAVSLISDLVLHVEAGAQSEICGVVEKDGKKYLFIENKSSRQGYSYGFWDLYSVDGSKITKVLESTFECNSVGSEIIYSSSSGTINGIQYSYSEYLEERAKYTTLKSVKSFSNSDDVMTLEGLLEYTKTLPIEADEKSIAVFTTEKSFSVKTGDSLWLAFGLIDGNCLIEDEEWSKMALTVSDDTIVSFSDYEKTKYGYSLEITGMKEGTTNLTVTDIETGISTIINISVYDMYSKTYSYPIEDMRVFYPNNKYEDHIATNIYNLNGIYVNNYKCEKNGSTYYVTFDAYNEKYHAGAVDVYDKYNNWIKSYEIEKFSDISGLWDTGEQFYYLASNVFKLLPGGEESNLLTYEQESFAKHSWLSIEVPDGGYFTISNNIKESPGAYLYNTSELFFDAVVDFIDLGINGVEPGDFAKMLMDEIQDDPTKKELFIELFKKTMEDDLSNFAKEIMDGEIDDACSNLVVDYEELLGALNIEWKRLLKSAAGVGEEVFESLSGVYGATLKSMFTFNKGSSKMFQVLQFAGSIDEPYATVYTDLNGDIVYSDGLIVDTNGNTDSEAVLQVFRVSDSDVVKLVLNSDDPLQLYETYNICFVKDDKQVQPNGMVTVRIPVPQGMKGDTCNVYRQENDGTWSALNARVEGNYLVFETDHFSMYTVIGTMKKLSISSMPAKTVYNIGETLDTEGLLVEDNGELITKGFICSPFVLTSSGTQTITVSYGGAVAEFTVEVNGHCIGDANGDGKVNVKDATQIQKAVAGLLTLDEAGESAADVDGSGKVNVKDATAIQKWVAGIETGFLIGEPVKKH